MVNWLTRWAQWSITAKILVIFLGLSVLSMSAVTFMALSSIRGLGDYALQSSTNLGESAIKDSTAHLTALGEETITQKARDVARQVELYLNTRPAMMVQEMRQDNELRKLAVQTVGTTGYTTILDPENHIIVIHKFLEQERDLTFLRDTVPSFWALFMSSRGQREVAGYYNWLEVDGSITEKYAAIEPIRAPGNPDLTLWATTYINEFSGPAQQTQQEIRSAIADSASVIRGRVNNVRNSLFVFFGILFIVVVGLGLLLSRLITDPIRALQRGAEAVTHGNLDYRLRVRNRDELGKLADAFNRMGAALKAQTEELQQRAAENIAKEHVIQENLRSYARQVSKAQEAERKRVARELHDDTVQSLVVVSRHLDDLAAGRSLLKAEDIRGEVRKILEGVRHFSQELRPSILDDLGLIPALKWLASDMSKNHGVNVDVEVFGEPHQLPKESELTLFRITQEALTNVRKHAQATQAFVRVEFPDSKVTVTIRDNGKGFDAPSRITDLARAGKLGLAGMQERAQLLGGSLQIESHHGEGTTLKVELPAQVAK